MGRIIDIFKIPDLVSKSLLGLDEAVDESLGNLNLLPQNHADAFERLEILN